MIESFFTGSRIYGTPRPDSDLDMVVNRDKLTSPEEAAFEAVSAEDAGQHRIGQLQIIFQDTAGFYRWQRALALCLEEAPITRARAIEIHKQVRINDYVEGNR